MRYYADCKTLAGSLRPSRRVAARELGGHLPPTTWAMHASNELGVSGSARHMAHNLLRGAGSWIRPPFWYRALTIEGLPARFREEFDLPFAAARTTIRSARPSPSAAESTAGFLRPSVLRAHGARRRHGWLIDRWILLPDGATVSGSAGHYYRLHETGYECSAVRGQSCNEFSLICFARRRTRRDNSGMKWLHLSALALLASFSCAAACRHSTSSLPACITPGALRWRPD